MAYTIWRACERFKILPPNVEPSFNACDSVTQSQLIAYEQLREVEEAELIRAGAGLI